MSHPHPDGADGWRAVFGLIEALHSDSSSIAGRAVEGYREAAEHAEATIDAIRHVIAAMLDGPFAPSHAVIIRALYPSIEIIDHYRDRRIS